MINDDYGSNKNDLKDGQNHRFEKKETLIWTTNWSGLHAFLKYKHYAKNSFKTTAGREKNTKNEIYNAHHGPLSQEQIDDRY